MSGDNFSRWNSYFYPGTDVLINKHHTREPEVLKSTESDAAIYRATNLPAEGLPGNFDLAHLQSIHKHLFQDTYEWAGQVRDVSMSKGKSSSFVHPEDIGESAARIQAQLQKANFFKGLPKQEFVKGLSVYYADLNKLHPFREGNGRSTRLMIGQLAERAGYAFDERRILNDKGQWNEASAKSMGNDRADFQKILSDATRPIRSIAFEDFPREEALAKHPELKPIYERLDVLAKSLEEQHPGNAKAQAHFMAHKRTEIVRQLDTGETKGLDMTATAKPAEASPSRFEAAWTKAKDYAAANLPDPVAREAFLTQFQAKMQAVERQGAPAPTKPREVEPGR